MAFPRFFLKCRLKRNVSVLLYYRVVALCMKTGPEPAVFTLLGERPPRTDPPILMKSFFFLVKEDHCKGFEQAKTWDVQEWVSDQDLDQYNRVNDLLMELYMLGFRRGSVELSTQQLQMYMMACYNLTKFRDFLFNTSFLSRFDLPEGQAELMRDDDLSLLEFAFQWLKFALFRIPTLQLKEAGRC